MRNYFLLFSVCAGLTLHGQQKIAEHSIGPGEARVVLHTITDKTKQRAYTIAVNENLIRGYLLNNQGSFSLPRKPDEELLGGFFKDDKFYVFLYNGKDPVLHNWVINTTTGETSEVNVPLNPQHGKIADRFSCGDRFICYSTNGKTGEIFVHDFKSEAEFTTTSFKFPPAVWQEITVEKNFSRVPAFRKVDWTGEGSEDIAASFYKMFYQEDNLYLLLNNNEGRTRIYRFNLKDQQVSFDTIRHTIPGDYEWQGFFVDNSFLLNDKLYYSYANPDTLVVQVVDLASLKIIKSFGAGKNEDISFKNSPIKLEGSTFDSDGKRELGKTKQLIVKMFNGSALIKASANSKGQVELAVGSYKLKGNHDVLLIGFNPFYMLYIPSGWLFPPWSKSARFTMILDPNTNEHVSGEPDASIGQRIAKYKTANKIVKTPESLFICNDAYHFAYYNKRDKTLNVVRF